jgi:hypothetical protein
METTLMSPVEARSARANERLRWMLFAWLLSAIALGASGALRSAPPQVIPLFVLATNALLFVMFRRRDGWLRAAVDATSTRAVLLFQSIRAVIGALFVYYGAQGVLPARWASHAGWGDLAVGLFAFSLVFSGERETVGARRARAAFNALGFLDIASVLVHAQYVALVERDARFFSVATSLPFAVVPFFVVPLVFATHALLWSRRGAARA